MRMQTYRWHSTLHEDSNGTEWLFFKVFHVILYWMKEIMMQILLRVFMPLDSYSKIKSLVPGECFG